MFDEHEWSRLIDARVRDASRLRAVSATASLDTEAEESFDRLTTLAGTVLDVPWAFVTLVDDRRSFWKSCFGIDRASLDERQNPVGESFCQYVVATGEQLLIEDTRLTREPRRICRSNRWVSSPGPAARCCRPKARSSAPSVP